MRRVENSAAPGISAERKSPSNPVGIASVSSSKCKVVHTHPRAEKFDYEFPVSNLSRLSYQLIHPRLADRAVPLLVNIRATRGSRRMTINEHSETNRATHRGGCHHQIEV